MWLEYCAEKGANYKYYFRKTVNLKREGAYFFFTTPRFSTRFGMPFANKKTPLLA
jgi:hypothetical protein